MKTITKLAFGAAMLVSAAATTAAPANAGVSIGLSVGVPGVGIAYANPCYRPYWYRPAYCGYQVYGQPIFVDGGWYRGPVYYRTYGGERYFWLHNQWTRDRDDFHRAYWDRDRGDFRGYGDQARGDFRRGDFRGYGDQDRGDFRRGDFRGYGDQDRGDFHRGADSNDHRVEWR